MVPAVVEDLVVSVDMEAMAVVSVDLVVATADLVVDMEVTSLVDLVTDLQEDLDQDLVENLGVSDRKK